MLFFLVLALENGHAEKSCSLLDLKMHTFFVFFFFLFFFFSSSSSSLVVSYLPRIIIGMVEVRFMSKLRWTCGKCEEVWIEFVVNVVEFFFAILFKRSLVVTWCPGRFSRQESYI